MMLCIQGYYLPHRVFYTCPLGKDDPARCKYFKWADELAGSGGGSGSGGQSAQATPTRPQGRSFGGGQTLGQSPIAAYGRPRPAPSPADRPGPPTAATAVPTRRIKSVSDDEIDWNNVDTDDLEREAIASTPGSSQKTASQSQSQTPTAVAPGSSYRERMKAAVEDGLGKRKREDDEGATPRKATGDVSHTSTLTTTEKMQISR